MPTRQQLEDALIQADSSGDRAGAMLFADMIRANEFDDASVDAQLKADAQGPAQRGDAGMESFGRTAVGRAARSAASGVNQIMGGLSETAADVMRGIGDVSGHIDRGADALRSFGVEVNRSQPVGVDPENADEIAQALSNTSDAYDDQAGRLDPLAEGARTFDSAGAFGHRALQAGGRMLPAIAAGSPALGAGAIGADVYGAELKAGKNMGLDEGAARKRAGVLAGIELVTEKIPLESFLTASRVPGVRSRVNKILKSAGLEALQEEIVTVSQLLYDADLTDEDYTAGGVAYQLAESVALGGALGGVLGAPAAFTDAQETPGGNDDVAAGIERQEPTVGGPAALDQLEAAGLDMSNIRENDNAEGTNQSNPLGPPEQHTDGALPGGSIDSVLGPTGQLGSQDPLASGRQADNLDGGGLEDGRPNALANVERGAGVESSPLQQSEVGLTEGPLAGLAQPVMVDGEERLIATPPTPSGVPELSPELEQAAGQELGILDEEGQDIEATVDQAALDYLQAEASLETPNAPEVEAAAPPLPEENAEAPTVTEPAEPDSPGEAVQPDQPAPEANALAQTESAEESEDAGAGTDGPLGAETNVLAPPLPDEGEVDVLAPIQAKVEEAAAEGATSPNNDLPEPTEAQKEAGNYKMGHVAFDGMKVSIENEKGSLRKGVDPDGNEWATELQAHYGYIRGTEGADGDAIDMFMGDAIDTAEQIYVKDQLAQDGSFDEHKILAGFPSKAAAQAAYEGSYDAGKVPEGLITALTKSELARWIKNGNHKEPLAAVKKPIKSVQDADRQLRQIDKRIAVHQKILDCVRG